jgi:hypothetical protein
VYQLAETGCSFCGKPAPEVRKLIAGPGVYICDQCVDLCNDILAGPDEHTGSEIPHWHNLSAEELLTHLPKVAAAADQVEAGLQARISRLREQGVTWARIGAALGMTRQSAWERFAGEE